MKKSKPCGTRAPMYEENPDRRIHCPEWSLHMQHYSKIEEIARKNDMSRSKVFETIMQNFFLLEKPRLEIEGYIPTQVKRKTVRKLTLHPAVIELIQAFSIASEVSSSRYINSALEIYFDKHKSEMDLRKLIGLI